MNDMRTPTGHRLSSGATDFIDDDALQGLLTGPADPGHVRAIIDKSLSKEPLTVAEAAALLKADAPESVEAVFAAARQLKRDVYGNRIVLFAPLYVGNQCTNDCRYCAFRRSNKEAVRRTLDQNELRAEVKALEQVGHKRLIMVFGEHPEYDAEFIARSVRTAYETRVGHGEIRRININAAPLDDEGYRTVKAAGIGTYQIFMETYHHPTYERMHPPNTLKGDYLWRLDGLTRAYEAGCDDVGIGALFGLYDWRFDVLGLVSHARFLAERFGVGPHTISFPRLRPAMGIRLDETHLVSDHDFKRLVAILRLAVPYTGLILTAREKPEVRRAVMGFGVSQIDAGSRIGLGEYTDSDSAAAARRQQFQLGDIRPLDEVIHELVEDGYVPSFCTACYRLGRTGEQFMEFAVPGFIQKFCTPNALLTFLEYLEDYASPHTRAAGLRRLNDELENLPDGEMKAALIDRLRRVRETDERDLYF